MEKMNRELDNVKEEMKNLGPKMQKEMEKVKADMEKTKSEFREYKDFIDGLDAESLISKKDGYSVKHQDGELIINGKKASEGTYNKYRPFLEKHRKFNLEKSGDNFKVNMD
jgi:hypothetical protein